MMAKTHEEVKQEVRELLPVAFEGQQAIRQLDALSETYHWLKGKRFLVKYEGKTYLTAFSYSGGWLGFDEVEVFDV